MVRFFISLSILMCVLLCNHNVVAQDTISTRDIQFTDIPKNPSTIAPAKASGTGNATEKKTDQITVKASAASQDATSTWSIFIAGFLGGLAALLMPCIFPMLPLTVSFFTKNTHSRGRAIKKACIYGLSIIIIYVVLGLIITLAFGADALNSLATNGIFNFLFFLLLVTFSASFLGAFEITLPNSWVNKMDANSERGGFAGLFFMAATLALVSFSCTGPIIGTLLVQAATTGAILGPAIGMFGFSLALAIPFALFAMFPNLLQSLPKSGGWLNSIKVCLGFLELALSLKFLSNVDLAYHWHWFDREIFLVLWIVISALAGFYLLGKLKFAHDSDSSHISVTRLFLSIVIFSFTIYMIPGLWGAPLKSIAAFLPPQSSQDFDLYTPTLGANSSHSNSDPFVRTSHKYADLFDRPQGLDPYFDYDEGLAAAKKQHKPIMIDFTGHACVNCRKMEATVWTYKAVYPKINNDYILIQLYVDDKTELPMEQQITSGNKSIRTIGNKWSDLQITKFASNSQPFYVLLDPETEAPLVSPGGADYDANSYLKFLESGINKYEKQH